ncbi:hypothetical protein ACOAPY_10585 [Pseudomonas sp. P3C3]
MGTTYQFISKPDEPSEVIEWFRNLESPPTEIETKYGFVLYFREMGELSYDESGNINPKLSPVATIFLPKIRRGIIWTIGEVHFLSTPFRQQYPLLYKISLAFKKWLSGHTLIYSSKRNDNKFSYYLEGSAKSQGSDIYAFPTGLDEIMAGRYFVNEGDNEARLDKICGYLRLRGLEPSET